MKRNRCVDEPFLLPENWRYSGGINRLMDLHNVAGEGLTTVWSKSLGEWDCILTMALGTLNSFYGDDRIEP